MVRADIWTPLGIRRVVFPPWSLDARFPHSRRFLDELKYTKCWINSKRSAISLQQSACDRLFPLRFIVVPLSHYKYLHSS
ncbi:MAG: hypothetical protein SAK29_02525 [Scytonema sp. PMC 1069.18]|nr:hypothetical protein [Scytonema sp. PMC 1069.18]MEC4881682.1 hypothetical protein [Scytonema sp. PMC 1070.18]